MFYDCCNPTLVFFSTMYMNVVNKASEAGDLVKMQTLANPPILPEICKIYYPKLIVAIRCCLLIK